MARKIIKPKIKYEYISNPKAVDEAFDYLLNKFFEQLEFDG